MTEPLGKHGAAGLRPDVLDGDVFDAVDPSRPLLNGDWAVEFDDGRPRSSLPLRRSKRTKLANRLIPQPVMIVHAGVSTSAFRAFG